MVIFPISTNQLIQLVLQSHIPFHRRVNLNSYVSVNSCYARFSFSLYCWIALNIKPKFSCVASPKCAGHPKSVVSKTVYFLSIFFPVFLWCRFPQWNGTCSLWTHKQEDFFILFFEIVASPAKHLIHNTLAETMFVFLTGVNKTFTSLPIHFPSGVNGCKLYFQTNCTLFLLIATAYFAITQAPFSLHA